MSYKVTQKYRDKISYDFICPNDHEFTDRVYFEDDVNCPECNQLSVRKVSVPHLSVSMGVDANSAQGRKWAKMHKAEAKRQNAKIDPNS